MSERRGLAEEIDDRPWIECWSCGGEGVHDDCFEDCCVCLNPPCLTVRCDVCDGKGGWPEEDGKAQSPDLDPGEAP